MTDRLAAALADRYRLERELGQGGMATVYLAEDLRHHRRVAIKVLKPDLAAVLGADRFVQEITTTAALQHPHILPLFDSGTADSFLYYVMPYVEGETLRSRLDREKQLGIDEAVRIAREVADALDYAHRHGVIHRDIKPENILLHDGRPMVADFGIALAVSAAAGGRMTETGLSLGTPHYMSPEQATAERELTGRSDIYSLGCVLYEMLTGNPPHVGATAQQIIMKIVTEEAASVTSLRRAVPPHVAAAVAQAVEKLPADRFESARAFADALADPGFARAGGTALGAAEDSGRSRALIGGLAAVALVASALAVWGWSRPEPVPPVVRYRLALPGGQEPGPAGGAAAPAPDGSFLVYHGANSTGARLWLKRRESATATPIQGSEGATTYTISPDGSAIACVIAGQLRRVPVAGGAPSTLVPEDVFSYNVAWLEDDTIIFTQVQGGVPRLSAIAAAGGEVTHLLPDDSVATGDPAGIWGTPGILFQRCLRPGECELWAVDRRGGAPRRLLDGGVTNSAYAASGHLVVVQGERLLGIPFDAERLEATGPAVTLESGIGGVTLGNLMRLSRSGTLVLTLGDATVGEDPFDMVWVDRGGRVTLIDTTWRFAVTELANNHG